MKFKVGDLVRVKTDLEIDKEYGNDVFISPMAKYRGNTYKVEKLEYGCYTLSDIPWHWTDEMLEPVAICLRERVVHIPTSYEKLFLTDKFSILPDVAGALVAKIQSILDNSNKLIINKPAVILYRNGKKYVVKTTKGDKWDEEKGVALALLKSFGVDYKTLKKIIEQAKRGDKKGK